MSGSGGEKGGLYCGGGRLGRSGGLPMSPMLGTGGWEGGGREGKGGALESGAIGGLEKSKKYTVQSNIDIGIERFCSSFFFLKADVPLQRW